jgi:6-pyruvoyltetrahydropterin/6-carboxytetrahydropterin synthase
MAGGKGEAGRMYSVIKSIEFCYGHRLCSYEGKCRHWHGHNGRVEIEVRGDVLGPNGMLTDFSEIKRLMKPWIDENLDHRMILKADDPAVAFIRGQGEPVFTMDENPTAEALAKLIFMKARELGLPVSSVRLWETSDSSAVFAGD